ncbi:MAG: hypothetical protein J7J98_00215 [candidate division Zixibacteria bacterium]|nr:hypothetical protein [candidate division Zixibacteria bacterium]
MKFLGLLFTLLLLSTFCHAQNTDGLELFDSALRQVGMTRDDVRFDADEIEIYQGHPWRLSSFSLFHKNPFKLPQHSELTLNLLTADANSITKLTARASRFVDHPIRRSLIGDPLESYLIYPDSIPRPSIMRSKNVLPGKQYNRLKDGIDLIYQIADDDEFLFRKGLKQADKNKFRERLFDFFVNDNDKYQDLVYELVEKVDFNYFLAGAQDFADAAHRFAEDADSLVFPEAKREIKTGKGLIVIGSTGDDVFEYYVPPLMIIDGGGNDTYKFGGYPNGYPLTVIIDFAGNDHYLSPDSTIPGIGGAVLGMSILIDREGNDLYEGVNVTQGAGIFGIGLLQDNAGDDVYIANSWSQAAATFGLGILSDLSGADSLHCLINSQGFGYTRGCGLLVDLEGDDVYVADDINIVNPASQTKEHNSSLAQGVGFGKRADYLDGHSWAGGVGILCDIAGNDRYSAGLFAQGCAYWHAVGMLLDGGGDDQYNGIWYVQGSGAHFGVGYLDDFGGDDSYTATHNMAVGAGHDFTVGYLNERGGNDVYTVPNLSLGGGNAAGIGIFHDHNGNDTYNTSGGTTLGRANRSASGMRTFQFCFGIFIDGGGQDVYDQDWSNNGQRWIGPPTDENNLSDYTIGVGIDWQ